MLWLFIELTRQSTIATSYSRPRPPILRLLVEMAATILVAAIVITVAFWFARRG